MAEVILFIATSLDGYIARPDGNIDWLNSIPNPEQGDYGYEALLHNVGITVMGRKTYEEVLGFGVEWPYADLLTYVVTHDSHYRPSTPKTFILTSDIKHFIIEQKKSSTKDIWLVGGSQLNTAFINESLIDRMIISIIPKIIGEGIPLFAHKPIDSVWKLENAKTFDTSVVTLTYVKV